MCFSAQASFVAGIGLVGLGLVTIRRVRGRAELFYGLIPMIFGVQQLAEGALWLTFSDNVPIFNTWLTYIYLFFSNVLWPSYVPFAVLSLESIKWRRNLLVAITCCGAAVSLYLLIILLQAPVSSSISGQHICYDFFNPYEKSTIFIYVIVTCVSLMISSDLRIAAFGVAAFVSEAIAYELYNTWFISVWCFFAAILSVIVYWRFHNQDDSLKV